MSIILALILAIIGFCLCMFSESYDQFDVGRLVKGLIILMLAALAFASPFILEDTVKARGQSITSQETITYEPLPFKIISSESDKSFYIHEFEKNCFHFYYNNPTNGVENLASKTIYFEDVFISDVYESKPMILEITTTYEYEMSKFEKWWLGDDTLTLRPTTQTSYEIYVPAGSIIETYDSEE